MARLVAWRVGPVPRSRPTLAPGTAAPGRTRRCSRGRWSRQRGPFPARLMTLFFARTKGLPSLSTGYRKASERGSIISNSTKSPRIQRCSGAFGHAFLKVSRIRPTDRVADVSERGCYFVAECSTSSPSCFAAPKIAAYSASSHAARQESLEATTWAICVRPESEGRGANRSGKRTARHRSAGEVMEE